jgi:hypothetical protein
MSDLASVLVCALLLFLGGRVLLQAMQSGRLPERLVGVYFICIAIGAIPALANNILPLDASDIWIARAFGHGMLSLGYMALYVFVWRCFGASSKWRAVFAIVGCCVLAFGWCGYGLLDGFARTSVLVRVSAIFRGLVLVWALCETLATRARLGRQIALGLGDPVVANRFTLWSVWIGALLGVSCIVIPVRMLVPDFLDASAVFRGSVITSILCLSLISAISLALSFFPPNFYSSWLRRAARS